MISAKCYKALTIILRCQDDNNNRGIRAREFGKIMWAGSPALKRSYTIGNGATQGVGLWLCAGSYLRKLQKKRFISGICDIGHFRVTQEGKDAMADFEKEKEK